MTYGEITNLLTNIILTNYYLLHKVPVWVIWSFERGKRRRGDITYYIKYQYGLYGALKEEREKDSMKNLRAKQN
jgi:hypothetical protein